MTWSVKWRPRAERLAADLKIRGYLTDDELGRAFAETPRHLFVPHYYRVHPNGTRTRLDHTDPEWLGTVYSDDALSTQYRPRSDGTGEQVSSSSTLPSLMAVMITELDVRPGMQVLEVGTGTGYNAAILCHLLGDENVTTIDIDPELVDTARQRLAELGYHPSFIPKAGSYDRVLATHAVRHIPHEWVRWTKAGGVILTDLVRPEQSIRGVWAKATVDAGSTTATGRLLPARGGFMGPRRTAEFVEGTSVGVAEVNWELLRKRVSDLSYRVLYDEDFAFFLSWHVAGIEWVDLDNHVNVNAPGGRHADVDDDGTVTYTLLGDIWGTVELAHQLWTTAGRPSIKDWTVLVTEDGRTTLAETLDLGDAAVPGT